MLSVTPSTGEAAAMVRFGVVLLVVTQLLVGVARAAERPNVVVILTDDQGWGDLSAHGNANLKTPHLDSLAKDGASFDRFFVQPVCSPTRAEFLTGRYHLRGGVRNVTSGGERLNLDEKTVADAFKAGGYATACFGKWHNGSQYPYHPLGRGFGEFYGFTHGHWGDYFSPPLDLNGKDVRGDGYLTDDLTTRAVKFIEKNKSKPFFCYLAFNTPHSPMQVPDSYWDRFKDKELKLKHPSQKEDLGHTRAALAMCENVDDNVGRLLKALDDLKLANDTIVVYFCDNGPNGWRWNGGMKGRKGATDEGGVRSPLFVRWPAKVKPGTTVPQIAGAIDLLPTLTELCGVKRVGDKPLDGKSFAPLLLGQKPDWPDRVLVAHWNGRVSARSQRHRLDNDGKLYDMVADPGQTKDVGADQPEARKKLTDAVAAWKKDVLAGLKKDDRPFPVGYRELPAAHLPARDATFAGKVQRSAPAPNCSYLTNWTAKDDSVSWHVAVETAGKYEVTLHYTCPKTDVGSTVEVSHGGAKLAGKVAEAHDPPLYGQKNDRVPRKGESYMKDFRAMKLGEIELPRGTGPLTLRATDIPGKQVMDVSGVTLTLIE
jgi:arylsulfatase A-like enzyme